MNITFKLSATLADYLPDAGKKCNSVQLEMMPEATIDSAIAQFNLPSRLCHLVLVDGVLIPVEQRGQRILKEGETLAIWPPVAGG